MENTDSNAEHAAKSIDALKSEQIDGEQVLGGGIGHAVPHTTHHATDTPHHSGVNPLGSVHNTTFNNNPGQHDSSDFKDPVYLTNPSHNSSHVGNS